MLSVSPSNVSTTILGSNTANFYKFYRPINLLLPYSLSPAAAIFFVVLGLLALKSNGVSASSGGFLQILTTARASETLNHVAEKSSLGGRENTATHLRVFHIFHIYISVRCIDIDSSDFLKKVLLIKSLIVTPPGPRLTMRKTSLQRPTSRHLNTAKYIVCQVHDPDRFFIFCAKRHD